MGQPLLRLTQILHSSLVDQAGERLGRVDDLVVHVNGGGYPLVAGLQVGMDRRQVFVPISEVTELGPGRVQLRGNTMNLKRFERREGELLLRQDILHRKVILVETGRLVPASDIALGYLDHAWRVVGLDPVSGPLLPRLLHHSSSRPLDPSALVDWSRIEPFVGHVPTAKLRLPLRRLKRLHPAKLADLVEAASHEEGTEILTAVHADPELEADVFEELDTEHQVEFLRSRSDSEAAAVLGSMSPDDAADLIGEIPQQRRASILTRLPSPQQVKVRGLLAYNPSTAGGIMTPDFIAVEQMSTVASALERVAGAEIPVFAVYVIGAENRLMGSLSLQALLKIRRDVPLAEHVQPMPVRLRADADFTDVALLMADYNLAEAPVVDDDDHLVGVVSVDDVLETLIPETWRRRVEGSGG
jgi:CBS domain-containing protein